MNKQSSLTLGLSSCPNDAFIFHALLHGLIPADLGGSHEIKTHMADVEELNRLALDGELEVSKISTGVLPYVLDKYRVLASGAALGWGVGPLLVSRRPLSGEEWKNATIAIPGKYTTANTLLNLHGAFGGPRLEMIFNEVMPAVESGQADAGLIIHEGRFTYQGRGLRKILDLGEWWEAECQAPLPLGVIIVRRDLDAELARRLERAISESLRFAWSAPEASRAFIRACAQEMDGDVLESHIKTFVTEYSENLGEAGKSAIKKLLRMNGGIETDIFLA